VDAYLVLAAAAPDFLRVSSPCLARACPCEGEGTHDLRCWAGNIVDYRTKSD
jgi:hypothetical protein